MGVTQYLRPWKSPQPNKILKKWNYEDYMPCTIESKEGPANLGCTEPYSNQYIDLRLLKFIFYFLLRIGS